MSDPAADLRPGTRVVVRYRLHEPGPGPRLTDVVGELSEVGADWLTVAASTGEVRVPRSAVVAAKAVPPRPSRRGAPHLALSVEDLQRVMVDGWPPLEREELGGWLLRAGGGFSNRANSVMTAGDPGMPLAAAVDVAERWYAARGLPPVVTLAGPEGFDPAGDALGAELLRRGYTRRTHTFVMTAATAALVAAPGAPADVPVEVRDSLDPGWLAAYARQRTLTPGVTERVLTGSPEQLFASVSRGGEAVAVARLSIAHAWAGLSCVWVAPEHRRSGLAVAMTTALAARAQARGIRSVWLQVEQENAAALTLYRRAGFRTHHAYEYLVAPLTGSRR